MVLASNIYLISQMQSQLDQLRNLLAQTALQLNYLQFNFRQEAQDHNLTPPQDFSHFLYSFRLVIGLSEDIWKTEAVITEDHLCKDREGINHRGHYKRYQIKDRENAVALARRIGVKQTGIKLKIPTKNIIRWTKKGCKRKPGGGRKRLDQSMQELLYEQIMKMKTSNKLLKSWYIRERAQSLSNVEGFKASKGWLDKFCRRYKLSIKPVRSMLS